MFTKIIQISKYIFQQQKLINILRSYQMGHRIDIIN